MSRGHDVTGCDGARQADVTNSPDATGGMCDERAGSVSGGIPSDSDRGAAGGYRSRGKSALSPAEAIFGSGVPRSKGEVKRLSGYRC